MKAIPYVITAGALGGLLFWLSPHFDLGEPFLGYSVGGALLLFVASKPEKIELATTGLIGLAIAAAITEPERLQIVTVSLAAAFGMAGMASMISSAVWGFPRRRTETLRALTPACVLIFFNAASAVHSLMAVLFRSRTYDLYAYATDGSFGTQISFLAGRLIRGKVGLTYAVTMTYEFIVVAMAAFYAAFMHRRKRPLWELMELLFGASLIGYVLYAIFPAAGPGYIFRGFPWTFLPLEQLRHVVPEPIAVTMRVPRNAVPSLHFGWALLIWWNCRSLARRAQVTAGLFVLGTAFSTMALGEHYLFDLIVALPFSLMVQALMIRTVKLSDRARWRPILAGFTMLTLWLVIGRFGTTLMLSTVALPWTLAIVTCGVCLLWAFRLPPLIPEMELQPKPILLKAYGAAATASL